MNIMVKEPQPETEARRRLEMDIERLKRECEVAGLGYSAHLLEMARLSVQEAPVAAQRKRRKLNS